MLGKLMKYEWKNTMIFLLPLHVALLLVTICGRLVTGLGLKGSYDLIVVVALVLYFSSVIIISIATTIYLLFRFYKNFFTDEGYLMFSLPVTVNQLLLSKLIIAVVWHLINICLSIVSVIVILSIPKFMIYLKDVFSIMQESLVTMTGMNFQTICIFIFILTLISTVEGMLMFYLSIAMGNFFGRHKIIGSFASYIAIYSIIQMTAVVFLLFSGFNGGVPEDRFNQFYRMTLVYGFVLGLVMLIGFYAGTHYILSKKLNLD